MDRPGPAVGWGWWCMGLLLWCGCSHRVASPANEPTEGDRAPVWHTVEFALSAGVAGDAAIEPRKLCAWSDELAVLPQATEHGAALLATHGEPFPSARLVGCRPAASNPEQPGANHLLRRAEIPEHLRPGISEQEAVGMNDGRRAVVECQETPAPPRVGPEHSRVENGTVARLPHVAGGMGEPRVPEEAGGPLWVRNVAKERGLFPAISGHSGLTHPTDTQAEPGRPADPGDGRQPLAEVGDEHPALRAGVPQIEGTGGPLLSTQDAIVMPEKGEPQPIEPEMGEPLMSATAGTAERHPGMDAVASQAIQHVRKGWSLASRGAAYSARAEFLKALRLLAEALDVNEGGRAHSTALAAGLKALKEAEDFAPRGTAHIDVASIVQSHSTPVLHGQHGDDLPPLAAMTRYHTYAQEQLANVAPGEAVASWALFGLGKLYVALAQQAAPVVAADAKAMVFHQAALGTCPDHALAANELAVLWARMGRFDTACALLEAAAVRAESPQIWQNLAVVQARLGRHELAHHATERASELARRSNLRSAAPAAIAWVSPEVFAGTARPPTELLRHQQTDADTAAKSAPATGRSWGRAARDALAP